MIDQICSDLERKAIMDGHVIGDGFEDARIFGTEVLKMACARCGFYAIVDPRNGRHLKSGEGRCNGK